MYNFEGIFVFQKVSAVALGGTLVLVSDIATSTGPLPVNPGKLWVKGLVEVYGSLTVGNGALDVADYYEANGAFAAINTVIGRNVAVRAGGTLELLDSDIKLVNDSSHDKFTPAEAWAAAGQGSLEIDATTPLNSAFTVAYLLTGVNPSASRSYTVDTNGGGVLSSLIPEGAFITPESVHRIS